MWRNIPDDSVFRQASLDGSAIEISLSNGTVVKANNVIDQLLALNYHRMLIDFEDHMDSASAKSTGDVLGDFRNKFLTQAILDLKIWVHTKTFKLSYEPSM